jgi:hypothetical protein
MEVGFELNDIIRPVSRPSTKKRRITGHDLLLFIFWVANPSPATEVKAPAFF